MYFIHSISLPPQFLLFLNPFSCRVAYRTVPVAIPPLRDRGEDILLLFRKFAADFAEKYRMPALKLTEEARVVLAGYSWPRQVREVKKKN